MNERLQELAVNNERILSFIQTGPVQRAAIEDFARANCSGMRLVD